MGTNTITEVGASPTLSSANVDQYRTALSNDHVPRNSSGVPEASAGRVGTPTYPWQNGYFSENVYINGVPLSTDPAAIGDSQNYIVSCQMREAATSTNTPLFLVPNGSTNSLTVAVTGYGKPANLEVLINGASVIVSSNITLTGLSSAPSTNNTALVDASYTFLTGQTETKRILQIPMSSVGSGITALAGKIIAVSLNSEIMLGYTDGTTFFAERRGAFINSSGATISAAAMSSSNTITLLKAAWIFLENTGLTAVATYTPPIVAGVAPSSPATNDYWYDTVNQQWKVWNGSAWSVSNRILIGVAATNSSGATIGCLSFEPKYSIDDTNTVRLAKVDNAIYRAYGGYNRVTVLGRTFEFRGTLSWNMATDLDSGVTEASNTYYYFYIGADGKKIISDEFPVWREDLNGAYHPYRSYRYCGYGLNDGSSNLGNPLVDWAGGSQIFTTTGTTILWIKPPQIKACKLKAQGGGGSGRAQVASATVFGGGGGGYTEANNANLNYSNFNWAYITVGAGGAGVSSNNNGNNGNATIIKNPSFTLTANGGAGGTTTQNINAGGDATGGDLNIKGGGNTFATVGGSSMLSSGYSGLNISPSPSTGYGGLLYGGGSSGISGTGLNNLAGAQGIAIIEYTA